MHSSWIFLAKWTDRMAQKYGGTVYDKESPQTWDWGQALFRELYGPDWMNNPDFWEENDRDPDQPCNPETLERAKAWEAGDVPDWVITEKDRKNDAKSN